MNLGKKGQSSFLNLVDLSIGFFIFIVFFFLVIFLLWTGTSEAESVSLDGVSSFKQTESAINNLRIQMQNGADLTGLKLTEEIASSRLLDGKVINSCYDYFSDIGYFGYFWSSTENYSESLNAFHIDLYSYVN